MTERTLILLLVFAAIALGGFAARRMSERRRRLILETARYNAGGPHARTILAFYGPGCDACVTQKEILGRLSATWGNRLSIEYRSAVDDYQLARDFGVLVVPTTVVTREDGSIASINGGLAKLDTLQQQLLAAS